MHLLNFFNRTSLSYYNDVLKGKVSKFGKEHQYEYTNLFRTPVAKLRVMS